MLQFRDFGYETHDFKTSSSLDFAIPGKDRRPAPDSTPVSTSGIDPNALIATRDGYVEARELKAGDEVLTRDNGFQPVQWSGRSRKVFDETHRRPVQIRPGILGTDPDVSGLLLPPTQQILLHHFLNDLLFGSAEVFCRAVDLLHVDGVNETDRDGVNWCQILFDRHETILVNGIWLETMCPDMQAIRANAPDAADEICEVLPNLRYAGGEAAYVSRCPSLNDTEASLLHFGARKTAS